MNKLHCLASAALALCMAASVAAAPRHMSKGPAALKAEDYAAILSSKDRTDADKADDAARKPAEVLAFARIHPGQRILEMEVGRGWYTEIISAAVGPTGVVVTQNPAEFAYSAPAMKTRRDAGHLKNVIDTTTHFDELNLPDASVDKVLWILGPHELYYTPKGSTGLGDATKAYAEVVRVLKPGGEFIVMDHAADAGAPTTTGGTIHRVDPAVVLAMSAKAGLKYDAKNDVLANPTDDRTKRVFDATIRRHTDQFLFRFHKPA